VTLSISPETLAILEAPPAYPTLPVGELGPGFEGLLGVDGRRYDLASFGDRDALVLLFTSNRCPTAKAYVDRLNQLQREYGPRGVQLVAINSSDPHLYPDERFEAMIDRAREDAYAFPYLVDERQALAKAYGVTCTFHAFLLDRERRLRYQGRVDNARLPARVTTHDLHDALDDVLAGRAVAVRTTRAFGCSLDFV
jgi:peroxiredoxin